MSDSYIEFQDLPRRDKYPLFKPVVDYDVKLDTAKVNDKINAAWIKRIT